MKKIILIVLILMTGLWAYGSFCDGFELGYKAGWCYGRGMGCLDPIPPLCPLPHLGEDTFQDGYHRGFFLALSRRGKKY